MRHSDPGARTGASLPDVDLAAFEGAGNKERRSIACEVDYICRSTGFLVLRNHGVPAGIVDSAWRSAQQFFALPEAEKRQSQSADPDCPRGYFPMASETLAKTLDNDTPPDLKESFSCGPHRAPPKSGPVEHYDFFYGTNIWPATPPSFRAAFGAYYEAMEDLGQRLMRLFAVALDLPDDYFAAHHSHHISALRALNYPPQNTTPLPGQLGAGAHTDYGSVTILRPDPDVTGLQVRMPDGAWIDAPQTSEAFIVNIGDMLARWTNDRWVSTLHRVVADDPGRRRQSIAYFQNPNFDADIRCLPTCLPPGGSASYPPVLAGSYLMQKFAAAQ